ncbi:hypothetical protein Tco_1088146 [Tanacetum coccineum]
MLYKLFVISYFIINHSEIIKAQSQRQADVHQDELCQPNKCYALMDANKKIDLDNPLCPNESKILANILQNHPLRFSIAASSSVPWIYLGQFWHTLKKDGSEYRLKFMLDRKELTMTLDDFRTIFQLPQATNNNHKRFVAAQKFSKKKIHDELEAKQNVKKVKEHLIAEEIEKLVEGTENVENNEVVNFVLNNQEVPSTRLEPRSHKESLEVEKTTEVQPVHTIKEEKESVEVDYELRRREREECRGELMVNDPPPSSSTPSSSSSKLSTTQRLLSLFMARTKFNVLAQHLQEIMEESLPKMIDDPVKELTKTQVPIYVAEGLIMERQQNQADVDSSVRNYVSGHILHVHPTQASHASAQEQQYQLYLTMKDNPQLQHDDLPIWLADKIKFEGFYVSNTPCRSSAVRPGDRDNPHDDAYPEGENNDDELLADKVSQEFENEMSKSVDRAKLHKVVDEMLRQRCTLGDEHQYYIDQMQNFLKNDIVWESRKEILTSPFPQKPIPAVQSCQRDHKAPALSLVNQDLLYLKKGNSGPEKIVLSLHKFPAVIFPDDDIEERTSRWVDKYVKKFNPYARYVVEHWKNPHAKIFYIKRQKEPGKPKEEVYSNSKIVQIIKTYGELGHENKFITEIIARRANGSIVTITELDYKNLNKNDIEDMYLLIINGKLGVESYQQKVNLTAPTITFPGIEKHNIVLEGLKSYNNDVKHSYVTPSLSKEDAEYLQLFEEEIEE